MKRQQLKQLIKEEIFNALKKQSPTEKETIQGSADFSKVASGLNIDVKI